MAKRLVKIVKSACPRGLVRQVRSPPPLKRLELERDVGLRRPGCAFRRAHKDPLEEIGKRACEVRCKLHAEEVAVGAEAVQADDARPARSPPSSLLELRTFRCSDSAGADAASRRAAARLSDPLTFVDFFEGAKSSARPRTESALCSSSMVIDLPERARNLCASEMSISESSP
eukprot:2899613-Pleurochrysis_carterae.AAC.3